MAAARPASERADHAVIREKLVEAGDDAERRPRRHCGDAGFVEGVPLAKLRDAAKTFFGDQARTLRNVQVRVVAQQDRIRPHLACLQRLEDVAPVAGGDVEDADGSAAFTQTHHRDPQQLLDVDLALADAAPADRVQIVAVDGATDRALSGRRVAIDVVERGAGIEAGRVAEPDALRELSAELQAKPLQRPVDAARRQCGQRRSESVGLVAREAERSASR